jgi:hypothetical protein
MNYNNYRYGLTSNQPDIRLFLESGTGIRPDTGYQKSPDGPAGYPVHPYFLQEQKLTFTAAVELEDNKLPVKQ